MNFSILNGAKKRVKGSPLAAPLFFARAWIKSPKDQLAILRDLRRTRVEARIFREDKTPIDSSKTALMISLTQDIYVIKLEAMFASALKLDGWNVQILTSRTTNWARSYFQAFGLTSFIYWDDYPLGIEETKTTIRDSETFMESNLTFQKVKSWTYQGAWIGPQILASVSRKNYLGAPDVTDPGIRAEIEHILPRVLANVLQSKKIVSRHRPTLALINEANGADMGPIVDMAIQAGTSVIQFVQPSRDDALILKRLNPMTRRIHPASTSVETLDKLLQLEWNLDRERELQEEFDNRYNGKWFLQSRNQQHVKERTLSEVRESLALRPEKKTCVVFSHVLWDANLFYGDDLFEDYGDWFIQTVKAAIRNPNLNWLIKLHPANAWKRARDNVTGELAESTLIREKIGALPDHVKLIYPTSDISTRTLFDICDYAVTVRGTAGVELPCFQVPTLTAGTGRYSGLGFTIDSDSREEYFSKLEDLQNCPPMTDAQVLLAKKHAYALFRLRPWKMTSFRSEFSYPKKGRHPLDQNLFPVVNCGEDLHSNGDLRKFSHWAAQLDEIDYLDDFP